MRLPLLVLHITAGMIGLLSGAAAITFRKGSRGHRFAGNMFVIAMLTMASAASCLAFMKHQSGNVFGGFLTIYMTATAWATARRREGETGVLDWAGFLFALAIGLLSVIQGWQAATPRAQLQAGVPVIMPSVMGSVILLAAVGDLRLLLRGISARARIVRHLWRMCFGWFIATGSFFLGQQQVFPASLRGSTFLVILAILPLLLLIFWMIRVRFTCGYKLRFLAEVALQHTQR